MKVRTQSEPAPLVVGEALVDVYRLLHRGQSMGLIEAVDEPVGARLLAMLNELKRVHVGTEQAAVLQEQLQGQSADRAAVRGAVNHLYAVLGESPLPEREWRSLLGYFDAADLGALLKTSESSVKRYAADVRTTPDHIADRLHWLAITVGYLSGSYNAYGIRRWFQRPRQALGGRSPSEALGTDGDWAPYGDAATRIQDLAKASTGMTVT